jgi:hypothetical protein
MDAQTMTFALILDLPWPTFTHWGWVSNSVDYACFVTWDGNASMEIKAVDFCRCTACSFLLSCFLSVGRLHSEWTIFCLCMRQERFLSRVGVRYLYPGYVVWLVNSFSGYSVLLWIRKVLLWFCEVIILGINTASIRVF